MSIGIKTTWVNLLKRWLRIKPKPINITGVEMLNCGSGLSVDDVIFTESCTKTVVPGTEKDEFPLYQYGRHEFIAWHAPKLPWYKRMNKFRRIKNE